MTPEQITELKKEIAADTQKQIEAVSKMMDQRWARIDEHFKRMRDQHEQQGETLKLILNTLKGDGFGSEGTASEVRRLKKEVKDLKDKTHTFTIYMNQAKWFIGIIAASVIALIGHAIKTALK
jgi:archaellum component FlaC